MELDLDQIRAAVKNSGYKTAWLAEKIGLDASTLTRFTSGKSKLGRSAMILLLQVLNLDAETLKKKAS